MNYLNHYNKLINRARNRNISEYVERHHIKPKCMGGNDSIDNIVDLTPEEHYLAHLLLVKIYPDNNKLTWAAIAMTGHQSNRRVNNKIYGWLKRKHQKECKQRKGIKNGSYNTIWINKIGTTENKKIKIGEDIPKGWVKGRKIKQKQFKFCKCGNELSVRAKKCIHCHLKENSPKMTNKLTEENVKEIKNLLKKKKSRAYIAEKFNISKWAVIDIDLGRTWKNI